MVSGQFHSQDALQKDCWKPEHGDRPCFPSSSNFDGPAKISLSSRVILKQSKPLYCNRSSSCRDIKSLVTLDSLNSWSPLQSPWIQRLTPASSSLGLGQSQNAEVRSGCHGVSYLPTGREAIKEPSSHGDFVKQLESHPHENNDAGVLPLADRLRQRTLNGLGSNPWDINYGASEEPPVVEPEARVCPIQLPTVESLLPGYSRKGNKRESFTHAGSPAKPLDGTRQSTVMTQSFYFPSHTKTRELGTFFEDSSCLGLAAAGKASCFKSFSVADQSHLMPESFVKVTPVSVPTKETPLGVGEHYLGANMNITPASASARASVLGQRDYYLNEPVCWRHTHVSEVRPVDNHAESCNELDTELRQTTLRVYDAVSVEDLQSVGSKSFHSEDEHISVYNARDFQESSLEQAVASLSGVSLGTTENLEASASRTEYLRCWKSQISEPNATSKSDACARAEKGNASYAEGLAIGMIMPRPSHDAEFSSQICDVKCVKPVQGGVMPGRCFQLESCASQGFQFVQLRDSAFNFEDVLKKSDVETEVIEWPFPSAVAVKDNTKEQSGSSSSILCSDLLQMNKLAEMDCSCVISERRGEVTSAMDITQPCSHSFEVDRFSERDSANCWHSLQKLYMDDVLYSRATHHSVESANDAKLKISLFSGMAVLSRPEFGTGSKLAEDEKLVCKYAVDRISKHNDLVTFPHVKHSGVTSNESGFKNSIFLQRFQNASSAESKLKTDSETLPRDSSINIDHLVKSSRPAEFSHSNLIKREMHTDRHLKMTNFEHGDVQSAVLGKRCRVEEQQAAGSMFHMVSDVMGSDANRSNMDTEFFSKPKMWMQRWCTATSMMKTQNSSNLDQEFKMSVVNNGKSEHHEPFRYLEESINQDSRGNAWCEQPEMHVFTQTENHKRRCNVQHETSMVVSGLDSEVNRRRYHANRKQSHFMKGFFNPSAAAMAVIGTTARQIHATKPQKKGLFGVWSSPKDHIMRKSEPQDAAFNSGGSKSELTQDFVLSSAEYPVTPSHV